MSNGITTLSLVAASLMVLAGCDARVASDQSPRASSAAGERNIRSQVDAANGRIWWLTREGVFVHDARIPQKRLVPIPGWVSVNVAYACPAALALGPNGEALVTSNILPTVWKIDPETLAVSEHALALDADQDKEVGFSGLVYSSEHAAFFAVSELGSVWRIDRDLTRAEKVALSVPMTKACGVAVGATKKAERLSRLCVRGLQGNWTVQLASDQRTASVRSAPCTDLPWLLSQVTLRSE
ncbi:MAG TPA: hypothetical protein VFA36_00390 [Burkholderiales bacterium]|jgi:hypothetical protein|nr:hypothetical protein [Burkholderiales bacterium]